MLQITQRIALLPGLTGMAGLALLVMGLVNLGRAAERADAPSMGVAYDGHGYGGWPSGMGLVVIRFLRLKYDGAGWDDGMAKGEDADQNFLKYFHELTGFKVAKAGEVITMADLKKLPRGQQPPFVFMTGTAEIRIPAADIATLREYLVGGGTLWADCKGEKWGAAFRAFVRQLFPEQELAVVPGDDPVFQMPYEFPNGAPPLWHYDGMQMLGVKHDGKWCVLYHPGGLHDVWKSGHSGTSDMVAHQAANLGINILYHAYTRYLETSRKKPPPRPLPWHDPTAGPVVRPIETLPKSGEIPVEPSAAGLDLAEVVERAIPTAEVGAHFLDLRKRDALPEAQKLGGRTYAVVDAVLVDLRWDGRPVWGDIQFGSRACGDLMKRDDSVRAALEDHFDAIFVLPSGQAVRVTKAGRSRLTEAEFEDLFRPPR